MTGSGQLITLYRIVRDNPPSVRDVTSNEALGKSLRDETPELRRLWHGISMFDSLTRARQQAKRYPWKGDAYIATIQFPFGTFAVEKTLSAHHFTVWGNPDDILEYVTHVERV